MASIPPLQPSSNQQSVESFLDALAGPLLDRSRLGRPALGFGYYEGEILDLRWRQALAEWARPRGLFAEHLVLTDLGESPTRRILARQRVGEHLFSIEIRSADLPDAALQQPTPVADLNIHRDTFRDERLCLLIWVPRERARRFLDLASNLVDYRTVDLDVPPFPEATPPVHQEGQQTLPRARHNLPMARLGQQFIGREEESARVQAMLLTVGHGAITDALALEGLGGIGKTRLAVEYAWDHLADYDWVFFQRADTMETLRAGLARLADHEWLDLPESGETQEERRVRAVLRWFEGHGRWLLILDNADSEQSAGYIAGEILPHLHRGHVLLTTRFRRWGGEVRALALAPLSESAAVRFLVAATEGQRQSLPNDPESAAALARALDGLPLALEQIAAWVRAKHCSFADALAAVTAEDAPALAWYDPRELRYPLPVAAVWERALEPLGAAEHFLLRFLAWLAPAPVPDFLIQALSPIWRDQDGTDFVGLARGLSERSLLTARADRTFLLHRLSLELERRRTPQPERFLWDSSVAEVLSTVVPKETIDVRNWPRLVLLQPHASDLFMRTELLVPTTAFPAGDARFASHLSTLLNEFGLFLHAKAELSTAEPLLRRALAIVEKSLGEDHPNVAAALNNLAQLLQASNRLKDAEPLMRRALAIAGKSMGEDHPNVATALNNLAVLLHATHRLKEAEPLMRRALAIDEQSYGPEHPDVARDLSNLAQLLQAIHRLEEAEPLMRRALVIDEQSYGSEHPKVAIDLNNLAQLLQATRRLEAAEPLMRRALAIDEQSFGPEHPDVARDLSNLARLLQARNRLQEAEPLSRRAVGIVLAFTRHSGHEHPRLPTFITNYKKILKDLGRSEAEIQAELGALLGKYGIELSSFT